MIGGVGSILANHSHTALSRLVMRFILWHSGASPWNYARFLNYCAERIFLRKVGGGYIFVHQLLLEYFATLGDKPAVAVSTHSNR
jgi:eukaryotic-like serine/threonine-protein kinase